MRQGALLSCFVAFAAALSSISTKTALSQMADTGGHHIQFGTRSNHQSGVGNGDGGLLLAEGPTGTIFVAGYAEGARSDTGGLPPKPMLVAFSRSGRLVWQQIYDRIGWEIVAVNARLSRPRIILWNRAPYQEESSRPISGGTRDQGRIELWTVDTDGDLRQLLLAINHDMQERVIHATDDAFSVWIGSSFYSEVGSGSYINARTYDWMGEAVGDSSEFSTSMLPNLYADTHGGLYSRTEGDWRLMREYLVYVDRQGDVIESAAVPGCGRCRFLDARRADDKFEVLATSDATSGSWRGLRLLNFDVTKGTVEVAEEYAALDGARVTFNDLPGGGVLLTGSDDSKPVIAKLSRERELFWVRRFESEMHYSSLTRAIELKDGSLAVIGITAPWRMLDSESDGDAILLISDADGTYLERFGSCIVADGSLASARYLLARQYGATIDTNDLDRSAAHGRKHRSRRLPRNVSPPEQCEETSEIGLLEFLEALLNERVIEDSPVLPDIAYLRLRPQHPFLTGGRAFRYLPSDSNSRMVPEMAADLDRAKDVAKELAANVVPYLNEIAAAHQWLEEETGFFFSNGDADAMSRHPFEWNKAYPLSPVDIARTAGILEKSFYVLEESEKRELRRYAGWFTQVVVLDTPGSIRKEGETRMYLPAADAGRFWRWILDDIRPDEEIISALESALESRLGITVGGRPPVKPANYRSFLEELVRELESVPDGNMMIRMEFTTDHYNMHLLSLRRGNVRLGSASADISAENTANWIQQVPPPE